MPRRIVLTQKDEDGNWFAVEEVISNTSKPEPTARQVIWVPTSKEGWWPFPKGNYRRIEVPTKAELDETAETVQFYNGVLWLANRLGIEIV